MSRTFLATLHFDGTGFVGWQRQPAGRSVQAEFERVLERLFGHRAPAHAAGRTDAGVHAVGSRRQLPRPRQLEPPLPLRRALNALLPRDCWVERVDAMRPAFTPGRAPPRAGIATTSAPTTRRPRRSAARSSGRSARPLDLAGARGAAATLLQGEHDFRAFAVKGEPKPHYRCRIVAAEWARAGRRPRRRASTSRPTASSTTWCACWSARWWTSVSAAGRWRDIEMLLERGDNQRTSPPAPPQGLYFVAATYPAERSFPRPERGRRARPKRRRRDA